MLQRIRSLFINLSYLVFWLILAAFATLVIFQVHATLIAISIAVIRNPVLRPTGWSMDTTYGLSRLFWLILGILWLGWVTFTEDFLREGKDQHILVKRSSLLLLIAGIIYGACYLILLVVG